MKFLIGWIIWNVIIIVIFIGNISIDKLSGLSILSFYKDVFGIE